MNRRSFLARLAMLIGVAVFADPSKSDGQHLPLLDTPKRFEAETEWIDITTWDYEAFGTPQIKRHITELWETNLPPPRKRARKQRRRHSDDA